MKRSLLSLLILAAFSTLVYAQEPDEQDGNRKLSDNEAVQQMNAGARDRLVIDIFSFDNWIHDVDDLEVKWFSRGFNFYFMYDIRLGRSNFSFAPGIGFSLHNAYLNSFLVETDTAGTQFQEIDDNMLPEANSSLKRYKLQTLHFDIPFEFRYRTTPNKNGNSFKMALGAKIGVLADSHTKLVYEDGDGNKEKMKDKPYQDLARFRVGPTFRIGFGAFNVYGYYGVLKMFKNGEGPDVNVFSVGISINGL